MNIKKTYKIYADVRNVLELFKFTMSYFAEMKRVCGIKIQKNPVLL